MLLFRSPLNTLLGYGAAAWGILQELVKTDEVSLFPIGSPFITSGDKSLVTECMNTRYESSANCLTIYHEFDLIPNFVGKGKHVGFPFFETNRMNEGRMKNLNGADHLIVASEWARQILVNEGVKPSISVAPLGVDNRIFAPKVSNEDSYKFFNIGKVEYRKGTWELPTIFSQAFPDKSTNVELYIFCDSPHQITKQQLKQLLEQTQKLDDGRIKICSGQFDTDADLASFIQKMDCGVFLTRAEGFGMPILQSLSCGKPVITTNYSGHTEFCTPANSFLIDIERMESAYDGVWFHGLGEWAHIGKNQKEQAIEYMRKIFKDNIRYVQSAADTGKEMSWAKCANLVKKAL